MKLKIDKPLGRWRLFFEWVGLCITGTWVFTTLRAVQLTYSNDRAFDLRLWDDLMNLYQAAPFGWALLGLVGPLWFVFIGLLSVLKTQKRLWHIITLVGTVIFGYLWPGTFWAWMSV